MTTSTPPHVNVVLRTVDDLLAVIPIMLGFHPTESLVLVVEEDSKIVLVARADLSGLTSADQVAAHFTTVWVRHPQAEFTAIAYTAHVDQGWEVLRYLDAALPDTVPLRTLVASPHYWYLVPGIPGGIHDPTTSSVSAQAVMAGVPVLSDRKQLLAQLAPLGSNSVRQHAVDKAVQTYESLEEARAHALNCLTQQPATLTDDNVALLVWASAEVAFLDAAILMVERAHVLAHLELWSRVVRAAPDQDRLGPLVVLGMAAWVAGRGALQVVCFEEVEATNPRYPWVRFLRDVNRMVLPSSAWEQLRDSYLDSLMKKDVA